MAKKTYFPPETEVSGPMNLSTVICQSLGNYEGEVINYDEE